MIIPQHRTIVHMDLDAFFVSVSRLLNPKLNGIPVLVGGGDRGVVAACSYEARKFGIHSAMPMKIARRLCPHATIIHGDYDEYSKRSDEVTQIIRESVPLFERSSIDEFYLDLTGMDKFFGCYKWATELREKIKKETHLPISFGMSQNKTVSKVATDEAKPDNQMKIDYGMEKSFLAPLSVRKIPMIGEKTSLLLFSMGIRKVYTLQEMPMELLQNILGDNGTTIWKKANGIDNSPVEPYSEQKSMSSEETFDTDTIDITRMKDILVAMVEKLCFRLRSENKLTACITVKIRYSDFDTHTMQRRISYTAADHTLIACVKELFDKLYTRRMLIRLIGVKLSHLVGGAQQINMFEDSEEIINLYYIMDKLRLLYGEDKIQRAAGISYSLRGFNPFNGVSSSPAALQKAEDTETMIPAIKSMNKLFNIKKNNGAAADEAPVNIYEYLLVISPPEIVRKEVNRVKEEFNKIYNHMPAIKSQPQITLINFLSSDVEEEGLLLKMSEATKGHYPFDVQLYNFNSFGTTIFIDIKETAPIINLLRSLKLTANLPRSRSFFSWRPHMTVAKGLKQDTFNKAMSIFKNKSFDASFFADRVVLLKRDRPFSKYEMLMEFELGK